MTTATMVEIRNVTKRFGAVTVLNDVSLDVPEGSATAVIGPSDRVHGWRNDCRAGKSN
jgi:ABC-type multidrug transport system ATPase subunit